LLSVALVVPALAGLAQALDVPRSPGALQLLRVEQWTQAVVGAGPLLLAPLALLLAGTTIIFVVQELIPAWRARGRRLPGPRQPDERLQASADRAVAALVANGSWPAGRGAPVALRLETHRPVAALERLTRPTLVVSSGLLDRLDEGELDAVVAHELAHLVRRSNLWLLLVWLLRAIQAASPPALILSRSLFEAEEAACDAIASRATRRPMALASGLLKVLDPRSAAPPEAGPLERARAEVMRRSDQLSVRIRVQALLALGEQPARVSSAAGWISVAALTALLWLLG
jgi:Zn-dependent protease with chaperone function